MRTTVTLDPDVEALLHEAMRQSGQNFKQTLNTAIRSGLARRSVPAPFRQRSVELGKSRVDLTKALALAGELDDQRIAKANKE